MVRRHVLALALVTLFAGGCGSDSSPTTPSGPSLSGSWTVSFANMTVPSFGDCTLSPVTVQVTDQKGTLTGTYPPSTLTCSFGTSAETGGALSGTFHGSTVHLVLGPGTLHERTLDGTYAATGMTGTVAWKSEGGLIVSGDWTAPVP